MKETRFDRIVCFTYSHEDGTNAFKKLKDNIPKQVKEEIAKEIKRKINFELNQKKIVKIILCLFDRKEDNYFIGRTSSDSPDIDNEVIVNLYKNSLIFSNKNY
ncbi:MAG: hypothetical protein NHF94_00730 [Candidatus Bostrichicola ureolyticus]|nr:MAG: hypothetical protein NHF94_00730 [Candidatus Bostrichicola ureolyticus]